MQRVVVYVPQELHTKLKDKLEARGNTISYWFRQRALEELGGVLVREPQTDFKAAPDEKEPEKEVEKVEVRCVARFCNNLATATGKVYNEGDWVDVPMCAEHAKQALKEYIR